MLLLVQATRAASLWRRRAFGLGSAGFGLIAVSNVIAGPGTELFTFMLIGLGALAIIGALVSLWRAYNAGELSEQITRARDALDEARTEKRER